MFVWTEVKRPRQIAEQQGQAREAMYRRELELRAGTLLRLGRSPSFIKARLTANVAWDFELSQRPSFASEIDKIVDGVVRRQSTR